MEYRGVELEKFFILFKNAVNMDADEAITIYTKLEALDGWDSLGKFMLISSVYSEYEVTLDVKEMNRASTVGDIWRLIEVETAGR
jgi:acyl carrier protein